MGPEPMAARDLTMPWEIRGASLEVVGDGHFREEQKWR